VKMYFTPSNSGNVNTGKGTSFWLAAGISGALVGGLLPLHMKPLVLLPILVLFPGRVGGKPHWAILPAILFCPFNFESLISRMGIPFVNPFNIAWIMAAFAMILLASRKRKFPIPSTPLDRVLIFNLMVTTLTIIKAWKLIPEDSFPDAFMAYQQFAQWLVFFWITAALVQNRKQARLIVLAVATMVAVASVFGIKDYLSTRAVSGGAIERSQGLFNQANYAASFFAYYLPVIMSVAMVKSKWIVRVVFIGSLALGTLACVLTFGRAGMMALALAIILLAVMKRSKAILCFLLIGAAPVCLDPTVRARFAETTQDTGSESVELDDSSGARLIAWRKRLLLPKC